MWLSSSSGISNSRGMVKRESGKAHIPLGRMYMHATQKKSLLRPTLPRGLDAGPRGEWMTCQEHIHNIRCSKAYHPTRITIQTIHMDSHPSILPITGTHG
jgi:hypothetical protein